MGNHMSDPAQGTLRVTACGISALSGVYSNLTLHGVVTAPGLPPTLLERRPAVARLR
jgi:hypothetical protein